MNGAFAAATLLGDGFSRSGWNLSVELLAKELGSLPIHVYKQDGKSVVKPCAEVELQLRADQRIADCGLTAIYSIRGQDSVRIPTLRSLSANNNSLAGAWQ
jgi:type VI secretion system protein ImpC